MKSPQVRIALLGLLAFASLATALFVLFGVGVPSSREDQGGSGGSGHRPDFSRTGSTPSPTPEPSAATATITNRAAARIGSTSPAPSSLGAGRLSANAGVKRVSSPRGSSLGAFARQKQAAADAAALPLEPPPVPVADLLQGIDLSDPSQRRRVVAQMEQLGLARREALLAKARMLGVPMRLTKPEGGVSELYGFRGDEPVYRTTMNINAAISSAASLIRNTAPYNLSGAGLKVGVWDGGSVRATHQEFGARVTKQDPDAPDDDHGTHVAGTVGAVGKDARSLGMAPAASIDSYDWWEDHEEMTAAGAATASEAGKLPLSNHSYGIPGGVNDMGRYDLESRNLDAVAAGLPWYLPFYAAGNSQKRLSSKGGYQSITYAQLAKNIVTIGAVNDAVSSGQRDPARGTMSSFSSWGPCDDGRIKPDLVANGVDLLSSGALSDDDYYSSSGTSMASPSAAGSAALVAELYKREFSGQFPRASLLKALLIHTADDVGNAGPDYKFGWGLIDVKDAADLILAHKADSVLYPKFYEGQVSNAAKTRTYNFTWDGVTPLKATLCWTDQPGADQPSPGNRTPNLVHNLDLRITAPDGTTVFEPFIMPFVGTWTTASMALPATKGDNNTDNVEQIAAGLPRQIGTYTMTVTVDGSLTTATQEFSIVLTGAGEPVNPPPVVKVLMPQDGDRLSPDVPATIIVEATDMTKEQKPGVVTSIELLVNGVVVATRVSSPAEFEFLPPSVGVYTFEARAVDGEGAVGTSGPVSITFAYPPPGSVREDFVPPAADDHVQALAGDPEGRIYIGGRFTKLDGGNAPRLGRLRPDGSVDPSFFVGSGPDAQVRALLHVPQDNGLYVGGYFANVAGTARRALVRLRTGQNGFVDGSLDPAFSPAIEAANASATPYIVSIARQSDGKILVGGFFSKVNGVSRSNLARLNPDGTLDTSFAPNPAGVVNSIALQPDGKILVGGDFSQVSGRTSRGIARLAANGLFDGTFATGSSSTTGGFDGTVNTIAVTLDGEVIVGGSFSSYNGRAFYKNMAKLLPTGVVDAKFNFTPGLNGVVNDLHLRPTGEILVSGLFTEVANNALSLAATPVGRVFQINSGGAANGTLDLGFNPGGTGANGSVLDSVTLPNGDILLAGAFTEFNGKPRPRMAVVAGFESSTPVVVSQLFHNIDAGSDLDFPFLASGQGPHFYRLTGPLPRGVAFDELTGSLRGVPLDAGRYDLQIVATSARGSSESTRFVLNVNDTKVSYAQWKKAWFTTPAEQADGDVSGPSAVRNAAGLSNYLVYALGGGSPSATDDSLWPVVRREKIGDKDYLTLTASKYAGARVTYRVERSEDLVAWRWSMPEDLTVVSDSPTQLKVRVTSPASESGRQFLRLKVLAP